MIEELARAATYGFGASFGRDLYKAAKKNPIVWAIIGILMIAYGWRNFYLGIGHGAAYKVFVTFLGSTLLIAMGTGGFLFVGAAMAEDTNGTSVLIVLGLIILSTLAGNIWGAKDRKKRIRVEELAEQNAAFLNEIGLRDSDFDTDLLQDADGNLLKLIEQDDSKIVFSVAGKRGLRAAIRLEQGRMVDFTGIVRL